MWIAHDANRYRIDDELLAQAMAAAGLSTKRATVEEGLRPLVRVRMPAQALAELKGHRTQAVARLEAAAGREPLLIGDLILLEVLQGARDEAHAARIERGLRRFALVPLLDADLVTRTARNYRKLRERGITIRKTADLIIGTYCNERRHALLHDDRDFGPMEEHPGLTIA